MLPTQFSVSVLLQFLFARCFVPGSPGVCVLSVYMYMYVHVSVCGPVHSPVSRPPGSRRTAR